MSKFFVVANLKMNKSFNESVIYLESLIQNVTNYDDEIILCPSNISLEYFSKNIGKFKLGIQDVDQRDQGQGTGSISASQVKDLCTFSIVGHSERRIQFNETDEIIFQKIKILQKNDIIPILCIGEDLNIRKKGFLEVEKFLSNQIKNSINKQINTNNLLIAYEPIWAIGTGKSASISDINDVINVIEKNLKDISDNKVPILYGGSVNEQNSNLFRQHEKISGILIGSASLDYKILSRIINNK